MNARTIAELYAEILKLSAGADIVNIDLHIHSPASKDFKAPREMDDKEKYIRLLDEVVANNIGIIAVTDHNTFEGFNKLLTIINEDRITRKKYKEILILCGIEITCYSNHRLAIFETDFSEDQQNLFLNSIGIEKESQGTEEAMADELGPSSLLQKISEYGGIAILAHADTEKGFFYPFFNKRGQEIVFKGKSLAKIVRSPYLYGIQVCSESGESRISEVIANKDYVRQDRILPFLYFSDAHGIVIGGKYSGVSGKCIGSSKTMVKLSYRSFSALKIALSDADTRIVKSMNHDTYPKIIGCGIKSSVIKHNINEYACFRFSNQLNCIIGARGTGKSTLIGIIKDVMEYETKGESEFNDRYYTAVVL